MNADRNIELMLRYSNYLDHADDGNGIDITTGEPLLDFDEWLNN